MTPVREQAMEQNNVVGTGRSAKIAPPQPDQIVGFKAAVFPYVKATALLEQYIFPTVRLAWPYFSVEATGMSGSAHVAKLQNTHNGAVMLRNMYQLKMSLGRQHEILGKIQVMSMELTTERIALSGHVMEQKDNGDFEYIMVPIHVHATQPQTTPPEAYRSAMNAVEFMRARTET